MNNQIMEEAILGKTLTELYDQAYRIQEEAFKKDRNIEQASINPLQETLLFDKYDDEIDLGEGLYHRLRGSINSFNQDADRLESLIGLNNGEELGKNLPDLMYESSPIKRGKTNVSHYPPSLTNKGSFLPGDTFISVNNYLEQFRSIILESEDLEEFREKIDEETKTVEGSKMKTDSFTGFSYYKWDKITSYWDSKGLDWNHKLWQALNDSHLDLKKHLEKKEESREAVRENSEKMMDRIDKILA